MLDFAHLTSQSTANLDTHFIFYFEILALLHHGLLCIPQLAEQTVTRIFQLCLLKPQFLFDRRLHWEAIIDKSEVTPNMSDFVFPSTLYNGNIRVYMNLNFLCFAFRSLLNKQLRGNLNFASEILNFFLIADSTRNILQINLNYPLTCLILCFSAPPTMETLDYT